MNNIRFEVIEIQLVIYLLYWYFPLVFNTLIFFIFISVLEENEPMLITLIQGFSHMKATCLILFLVLQLSLILQPTETISHYIFTSVVF